MFTTCLAFFYDIYSQQLPLAEGLDYQKKKKIAWQHKVVFHLQAHCCSELSQRITRGNIPTFAPAHPNLLLFILIKESIEIFFSLNANLNIRENCFQLGERGLLVTLKLSLGNIPSIWQNIIHRFWLELCHFFFLALFWNVIFWSQK